MKVKVNDKVLVIAGKYKGKTGTVLRIYKKPKKITVEKINIRTKHIKKTATHAGQRIQFEAPFSISNVKVICPNCNKATRVGFGIPEKGKKYRICKKCNESVEQSVSKVEKKSK